MSDLKWIALSGVEQLDEIDKISQDQPVMIFKHSTRCSISAASLNRMERKWDADKAKGVVPYFLDLITFRSVSNEVAQHYDVAHQSPQVLIIRNGQCIYDNSHFGISFEEVLENINPISA